jgi:hypothetical protein
MGEVQAKSQRPQKLDYPVLNARVFSFLRTDRVRLGPVLDTGVSGFLRTDKVQL